jgi:hypothetical protein
VEREPWIELYNAGTTAVSLDGLYLANNYTNLTNWAFPSGRNHRRGQFMVIFCDGQARRRPPLNCTPASGSPADRVQSRCRAFRRHAASARLRELQQHSTGPFIWFIPDGQPFDRQEFAIVTPGATNNGSSARSSCSSTNGWPGTTNSITDPADGDFDDWFELYNPGDNAVDLAGYYPDRHDHEQVPIPDHNQWRARDSSPKGYLLVWADSETGQNLAAGCHGRTCT